MSDAGAPGPGRRRAPPRGGRRRRGPPGRRPRAGCACCRRTTILGVGRRRRGARHRRVRRARAAVRRRVRRDGQTLAPALVVALVGAPWSRSSSGSCSARPSTQAFGGLPRRRRSACSGRGGPATRKDYFAYGLWVNVSWFLGDAADDRRSAGRSSVSSSGCSRRPVRSTRAGRGPEPSPGAQDRPLRRRYALATVPLVALFGLRLAVQLPLYFSSEVAWLGTAKLVDGRAAVRRSRCGSAGCWSVGQQLLQSSLVRFPSRDEQQLVAALERVVGARARSGGRRARCTRAPCRSATRSDRRARPASGESSGSVSSRMSARDWWNVKIRTRSPTVTASSTIAVMIRGRGDGDVDAPRLVEHPLVLRVVHAGDRAGDAELGLGQQRDDEVRLVVAGRRHDDVALARS